VTQGSPDLYYTYTTTRLGVGASGSVYIARNRHTREKVAIKKMELSAQPKKEQLINEIIILRGVQHPNIVGFKDAFLSKTHLYIVMEFMNGGMLTNILENNSLSESQIATVCLEVPTVTNPRR
jgi:serine/threonine protein kinase